MPSDFVNQLNELFEFWQTKEKDVAKRYVTPMIQRTGQYYGELIRAIDSLQDKYGNILNDVSISLPRIIVVGTESSGKR